MSDRLITAFDEAVQALEAGAPLEAVLARYPELADELRPMLLAVQAARPPEPLRVPRQSEAASLQKLLGHAQGLRQAERRARPFWQSWTLALRLGGLALVLAVSGLGAITASADSLPGDALYSVKRAVEAAQLALAFSPADRAGLEQQFADRRLTEARAMVADGRTAPVTFTGLVESQTAERWQIAGLQVVVAPSAVIGAAPAPGQLARVTGEAQAGGWIVASRVEAVEAAPSPTATEAATEAAATPGPTETPPGLATATPTTTEAASGAATLTATPAGSTPATGAPSPSRTAPMPSATALPSPTHTLPPPTAAPSATPPPPTVAASETPDDDDETETPEPDEVELSGPLEATGGSWVIGGQSVAVTGETEIRDDPQIGDRVKVKAYRLSDGSLVARRIEKDD